MQSGLTLNLYHPAVLSFDLDCKAFKRFIAMSNLGTQIQLVLVPMDYFYICLPGIGQCLDNLSYYIFAYINIILS